MVPPKKVKTFALRSPSGEIVKGWNLSKFCRENNLDLSLTSQVVNGQSWAHRGWTRPDKEQKDFVNRVRGRFSIKSPSGEIIHGGNLWEFCKENNLNYRFVAKVVNGFKDQYKGWTLP